jgi:hypothetical protein
VRLPELAGSKSNGRQTGFTKARPMILMDANRALSARDVCDRIQEKLPPMLERHNNPIASVTTVLNRLVAYGEARLSLLKTVAEPGNEPESVPKLAA